MKKPTLPGVKRLAEVTPNHAALQTQRLELGREDAALFQELLDIAETERTQKDKGTPNTPNDGNQPEDHSSRVARLLGGKTQPAPVEKKDRKAEINQRRVEIAGLLVELDVALEHERRVGSAMILDQVATLHRERVQAVAKALRDVHAANVALHQIADALQDDGVLTGNLTDSRPSFLGWPKDSQGPMARYFAEMKRAGYISERDIPEDLR